MNKEALTIYRLAVSTALLALLLASSVSLLACASDENSLAPKANNNASTSSEQQATMDASEDNPAPVPGVDSQSPSTNGNSEESDNGPEVNKTTDELTEELPAGTTLSEEQIKQLGGADALFCIEELPGDVFQRMKDVTFTEGCPVSREELRYVRLLHVNAEGDTLIGEMVCNAIIAEDIVEIFSELYRSSYPIERICLADDYGGDDEASMQDNNTSCFNHRLIEGSGVVSRHSYGMAIDVNPLYNPYNMYSTGVVLPTTATAYTDRSIVTPYTIQPDDYCCQLFAQYGYTWGGYWDEPKDYQHFEKW